MKNALKKWYNYLIGLGLVALVAVVAIVPFILINDSTIWPKIYISYIALFSGVVFAGGGFIAQDIYRAMKRKETKNWDYPLEDKYINTAWRIYFPFLFAAVVLVIAGLISYLFLK